jgi:MORN repeat
MHGSGTRRFKNGDVYIGNYENGKRAGEGRFYFANGDMYYGNWDADQIHGFGRYYYNSGISFEGTFQRGARHGKGKLQKKDGELEIYRYENNTRVDPGVRWSADRTKAWRLEGGRVKRSVTIAEAVSIGYECEGAMEDSRPVDDMIAPADCNNLL